MASTEKPSMHHRPHPITDLRSALKLIDNVIGAYGTAAKARSLPSNYASMAESMRLASAYGDHRDGEKEALFERTKAVIKAEQIARGEAERDKILLSLAEELERVRAVLPSIAAAVSVEMGVIARRLAEEVRS